MTDSAIASSSTEPYDKEIDMPEEKILEHKTIELEAVNEKLEERTAELKAADESLAELNLELTCLTKNLLKPIKG